jgi:hypothetical protein
MKLPVNPDFASGGWVDVIQLGLAPAVTGLSVVLVGWHDVEVGLGLSHGVHALSNASSSARSPRQRLVA